MCEIAIVDPSSTDNYKIVREAMGIYEQQRSSLGLVGVYHNTDENKLEYNVFKAVVPDRETVWDFVDENEDAGWLIIHGRMATSGGISVETAHPLAVDCECCDIDYVLHNGVIGSHELKMERLEKDGHEMETEVDTEIIAHQFGDVPDLREDDLSEYDVMRQPAYILLNEQTMFIYTSRKYELDKDGYMSVSWRNAIGPSAEDESYQAVSIGTQ